MRKKFIKVITIFIIAGLIGAITLQLQTAEAFGVAVSPQQQREAYIQKRVKNPHTVLQLELATVKREKQHWNNSTIESREFQFNNGDLYWHDKITFEHGGENLIYIISYKGVNGTLTYYNEKMGKWIEEQELTEGRLPVTDLFLTIGNRHILLNQPFIYKDLGCGVVKAMNDLCHEIMVTKTAEGFQLQMCFVNKPGTWGEIWALESDSPLLDWNYGAMRQIWVGYSYAKDNRWLMDGSYYIMPKTYSPYQKNTYWKNPGVYVVSGFILTGGSKAADDLGYAQLYIQAQNMDAKGYMKTMPRSNWLYNAYGIEADFYDSRFNTDLGILFIEAYEKFNEQRFLDYALKYGNFFMKFANKHHYTVLDSRGKEGWLVQDYYHENGKYRLPHSSLNHQLEEIRFLYKLGKTTGNSSFTLLGDKMLKGIENTCNSWIKSDKNLYYCYYANGKFGGADYPYLTYNDLFNLQKLLEDTGGDHNPYLQKLMDAKKIYMDSNGIRTYKK
ncbi:MAG: hypothetical protein GXY40_01875 [Syntrophomonadaceae bacterium]|jgi:hypothetical protein|nr:hypothetical protein [Syntrophomonadaceae bacterium]